MFQKFKVCFSYLPTVLTFFVVAAISFQSHALSIEADYPLLTDLEDTSGNNFDVFLQGNPAAPALPVNGVSLCSNGIYLIDPDGQDIQTPIMSNFNINHFQVLVDFNITELPDINAPRPRMPVIMGGNLARWLGIYVDSNGVIGIKHNNFATNYIWSTENFNASEGVWYEAELNYDNGLVSLYVDQVLMLTANVGPLVTFNNDHNFTVTDFSEGNPFFGCIRNLTISYEDLIFANGFD